MFSNGLPFGYAYITPNLRYVNGPSPRHGNVASLWYERIVRMVWGEGFRFHLIYYMLEEKYLNNNLQITSNPF
jgi:hypothetical protein